MKSMLSADTALTGGSLQLTAQLTDSNSLSSSLKQVCSIREQPSAAKCPCELLQAPSPGTVLGKWGRDFSLPEQSYSSFSHCFQVKVKGSGGETRGPGQV